MTTGGGAAKLNETMATIGIPGLRQQTFSYSEGLISNWWVSILDQELLEAGKMERQLAIEEKDLHDGIPAVTVIVDGGWSKRSHKHSFKAAGGVIVIIGQRTSSYCT